MVPLARIGLATPSLPMTCSTTELQRRQRKETYTPFEKKSSIILYFRKKFLQVLQIRVPLRKRNPAEAGLRGIS